MIMRNLLSIIIPVYNTEQYLRRCLDSVTKQRYSDIEIIIVNDGSTDKCGEICDQYAEIDARIRVIHKKNAGLVAARKTGLESARGEYVAYVDSDDWIDDNAYDELMEVASKYKPDFIACSFYKNYEGMESLRQDYPAEGFYTRQEIEEIIGRAEKEESFFCQIINSALWCKLLKRSYLLSFQEAVPDEIAMSEDLAVILPMFLHAESIYVSKIAFYHYFQNRKSMSYEWKHGAFERWSVLVNHLFSTIDESVSEAKNQLMVQSIYYTLMEILYDVPKEYWKQGIPFLKDIHRGTKVAVYGKGSYAKNLLDVIQKNNLCELVLNVDSVDATRLFQLDENAYDCVIIAILDNQIVGKVKTYLKENGITENRIKEIEKSDLKIDRLPRNE